MNERTEPRTSPEFHEFGETLSFLIDLAKRAGAEILTFSPDTAGTYRKGEDAWGDFVTQADLASQTVILAALREQFPEDQILSEEESGNDLDYTKPVWMIDPLDGTKEFLYGGDRFSVMIGRWRNGKPDLGVVYAPAAETLLFAEQGEGAWRQVAHGPLERLHVNAVNTLDAATFVVRKPANERDVRPTLDQFDRDLPIKQRIPDSSIGLKFGRIAAGEAEASINTNRKGSKWDTCAPEAILTEAGGIVTDLHGDPLDYTQSAVNWEQSFVASNGVLHEQVIALSKQLADTF